MLVLTRHPGEQIVIAGSITITVTAVEGNKVRLGIDAPRTVRVDRAEIHDRRLAEEAEAQWSGEPVHAGAALAVRA